MGGKLAGPSGAAQVGLKNPGRVPSFEGDAPLPLRNDPLGRQKRSGGWERVDRDLLVPAETQENAGRNRAVSCLLRRALRRPLRNDPSRGQKRRVGQESETETRWAAETCR